MESLAKFYNVIPAHAGIQVFRAFLDPSFRWGDEIIEFCKRLNRNVWGVSSVGRAPESHSGGRGFDPHTLHHRFHLVQCGGPIMKAKTVKPRTSVPEIVLREGKPVAVILGMDEYREMLERLEDIDDLKTLDTMRQTPLTFRGLDEFLKDYSPPDV